MAKSYSISELAAEFNITTRTIRFYEEKKLLCPSRNGSTRIYDAANRTRLKLILRGKRLGLSLDESLEIIEMYQHGKGSRAQLQTLLEKIREKQAQLEQQFQDLKLMRKELKEAENNCLESLHKRAEN